MTDCTPGKMDLLPCPFCGDTPTQENINQVMTLHYVLEHRCTGADVAISTVGLSKEGVVRDWNGRVETVVISRNESQPSNLPASEMQAEIDQLRVRERVCPTMQEAESRALLRALMDIALHLGMDPAASTPAQIVDAAGSLEPNIIKK